MAGKEATVDVAATVSSKGQVTIPKQVRDALGISEGDSVLFRVEGSRATLARTQHLLDLAGTVSVPAAKRGATWDQVRRSARSARAERVVGGRRASRSRPAE
jgi:antitoxin PrlF